jgi:hypothetical protein
MAATPESIMATDSPVFDNARSQMALALDRTLGGICGMRATEGRRDDAVRITALLFDGLRRGAEAAE